MSSCNSNSVGRRVLSRFYKFYISVPLHNMLLMAIVPTRICCVSWILLQCLLLSGCLSFTPLGPDHPRCASGSALTNTARVFSVWWNIVLYRLPWRMAVDLRVDHECTNIDRTLRNAFSLLPLGPPKKTLPLAREGAGRSSERANIFVAEHLLKGI